MEPRLIQGWVDCLRARPLEDTGQQVRDLSVAGLLEVRVHRERGVASTVVANAPGDLRKRHARAKQRRDNEVTK